MSGLSPIELLLLPDMQRKIVTYLTRNGAADAETLAGRLEQAADAIDEALAILAANGHVYVSDGGLANVNYGQARRGRHIPEFL